MYMFLLAYLVSWYVNLLNFLLGFTKANKQTVNLKKQAKDYIELLAVAFIFQHLYDLILYLVSFTVLD